MLYEKKELRGRNYNFFAVKVFFLIGVGGHLHALSSVFIDLSDKKARDLETQVEWVEIGNRLQSTEFQSRYQMLPVDEKKKCKEYFDPFFKSFSSLCREWVKLDQKGEFFLVPKSFKNLLKKRRAKELFPVNFMQSLRGVVWIVGLMPWIECLHIDMDKKWACVRIEEGAEKREELFRKFFQDWIFVEDVIAE